MSTIAPNSEIWLIKAPIESDNLNHLNFANQQAQLNYFQNLPHIKLEKYTYIRQDGSMQVEGNADNLMRYNYMLYKNTAYGNKWIFAFITNVEFLANDVSRVSFRTDVFNTWYFDVEFKTSYIEREHTNDDRIGVNTLNEDIMGGEYVCNYSADIPIVDNSGYYIAIQCVDAPNALKSWLNSNPRIYSGLKSGAWVVLVEGTGSGSDANFNNLIKWFDYSDKTKAIIAMYLLPKSMAGNVIEQSVFDPDNPDYGADVKALPSTDTAFELADRTFNINTSIHNYIPKNNRLFCWPYNYIKVSNHSGLDTIYHWEDFRNTGHAARFVLDAIPNQGIDSRLIPMNYKFSSTDKSAFYDYGLTGGKMPLISWKSDYYLNWQAQNGINQGKHSADYMRETNAAANVGEKVENLKNNSDVPQALDLLAGIGQSVGSFLSSAGQFFSNVKNDLSGAGFRAYMTPDTIGGCANVGDLNFSEKMSSFNIQYMSIKNENAVIIDNYFSMFGYKTLRNKTPNINGRRNWNYVKTKNCNVVGDIPQSDLQEIKAIFNSGVTIWHNPETFLDYTQNNDII